MSYNEKRYYKEAWIELGTHRPGYCPYHKYFIPDQVFPNMVHLALLLIHSRLGMLKIWIHITESLLHLLLLKRRIVIYYQIILDIKSWKADPSKTWSQANKTKEAYFISNMTSRVMKMIKKLKKPRKCFHFFENCIKTVSEAFKLIRFFSSQVWNGKKKRLK